RGGGAEGVARAAGALGGAPGATAAAQARRRRRRARGARASEAAAAVAELPDDDGGGSLDDSWADGLGRAPDVGGATATAAAVEQAEAAAGAAAGASGAAASGGVAAGGAGAGLRFVQVPLAGPPVAEGEDEERELSPPVGGAVSWAVWPPPLGARLRAVQGPWEGREGVVMTVGSAAVTVRLDRLAVPKGKIVPIFLDDLAGSWEALD
ncbi:unnamed protein product, partial [Prorocentrum cordatum]